jgi:hypothetical protein
VGQERLGPSCLFISLVLGPLNSLVWYVPSLRYTRGLGWRIHCGVEVTESSTNKQNIIITGRNAMWHSHQTNGPRWEYKPCHIIALYKVGDTSSNHDPLMVGIRSPDGLVVGLAPATLEFWVRFPNERNQGKQAHPVLKYRVPHGSHLIAHVLHSPPPPTRTAL